MTTRTLIVCNQLPYPARDGVTLPLTNYIDGFRDHGDVDLLLIEQPGSQHQPEQNLQFFDNIFRLPVISVSNRFAKQMLGRLPYFAGWCFDRATAKQLLASERYNVVFSTPRATIHVVDSLRKSGILHAKVHVAAVNDIAALAKRNLAHAAIRRKATFQSLYHFSKLQMQRIGLHKSEINLLRNHCDLFVVQSDAEAKWVNEFCPDLSSSLLQLSNGVDRTFLETSLERDSPTLTFVGKIEGEYIQRMRWITQYVWPKVKTSVPDATFTVSGKCTDSELLSTFNKLNIIHHPFVELPQDLYAEQSILIAPIFKGFGLINKVVQAMAAGTIVVGDRTAFNGIPDFKPGRHGMVCETEEDFPRMICQTFRQANKNSQIRQEARELIRKHFQWSQRLSELNKAVDKFLWMKDETTQES